MNVKDGRSSPYELIKLKEGRTHFYVPEQSRQDVKGPYRARGTGVFYNPQMMIARDFTIAVVEQFINASDSSSKKMKFLDGLAGTGIRGLRLAKELEVSGDFSVTLNDGNRDAMDLINTNIKLNKLEDRASAVNDNLNTLLTSSKFQFIDIDPFGSAVSFFDNAVRGVRSGGLLAVTSTDTAPLCGTYPRTCKRRYDAEPFKNEFMRESGLRILTGAFARTAAKYDLAVEPVLLYGMDYYNRLFLKVSKGAHKAQAMLDQIGFIIYNKNTGDRYISDHFETESEKLVSIGPLWLGVLNNADFVRSLNLERNNFGSRTRLKKFCSLLADEGEMPPWFFEINALASKLKIQPIKLRKLKQILEDNGFSMVLTHFSPQGFKTDARMHDLRELLR
jgi:tRNA (guanine26-N2/guanine27-N2)-dimethyltransferase